MRYVGYVFWGLNAVVALYSIFHYMGYYGRNGQWGLTHPAGGWLWIWHGAGVAIVPYLGWSPWHLLWWFPVGFLLCFVIGKLLRYDPL